MNLLTNKPTRPRRHGSLYFVCFIQMFLYTTLNSNESSIITLDLFKQNIFFGMAAMPFLCYDTLLFQGNLPRVLSMIIYKYASFLILYIDLFLFMCGEWSILVFKDSQKYFSKQNVVFSICCNCFEDCLLLLFHYKLLKLKLKLFIFTLII